MGTPHKNYRENPKRAVYITGKINQELVDKLTPLSNELRLSSQDPITVYIDSPGGAINLAEAIRSLLRAPDPNGNRCKLITVVTGTAASAAADLLALGDYAIAYDHSEIIYHGSRQPLDIAFTSEMASRLASSLQQTNEFFAVRLARHSFPRFILRLSQFKEEFQRYVNDGSLGHLSTPLRKKMLTPNAKLLREAMQKQKAIGGLTTSVFKHMRRFKKNGADLSVPEWQAAILNGILKFKVSEHKKKKDGWLLSETGLPEVANDFNLLHDFHFGSHKQDLARLDKTYGPLVLTAAQKAEYEALETSPEEKDKWLCNAAEPKLQPIWYLIVSLCRLLQGDDFDLSSEEAYWLGLIDEVPGSGLPNLREMVENLNPNPDPYAVLAPTAH